MIEVTAELVRGTVYIAGETIECRIRFYHVPQEPGSEGRREEEVIAWASAQIHCQRVISESRVLAPGKSGDSALQAPAPASDAPSTALDIALQVLDMCTGRRKASSYNVSNERGLVCRFTLFKQAYKLGEDVIGTFLFPPGAVPCVQVSVSLQCEEEVAEESSVRRPPHNVLRATVARHHEYCLHTASTHLSLPIPVTAYPTFLTDLVAVRWRLHFEFVTTTARISEHTRPDQPNQSSMWQGPPVLEVETMVWDLAIKVWPTNPLLVSAATPTARPAHTVTF